MSEPAPPHPAFAGHFTRDLYQAAAGDVLPFDTDAGSDMLHQWIERADELSKQRTLRFAMAGDVEDAANLRRPPAGSDAEEDEELIAAGFALLYITGNIDTEGRRWLKAALKRAIRQDRGPEYQLMLTDLESFTPPPPDPPEPPPGPAQLLESGAWLPIRYGLLSFESDKPWKRWVRQHAREDRWKAWWQPSGYQRLLLHPCLSEGADSFEVGQTKVELWSTSADLIKLRNQIHARARSHEEVLAGYQTTEAQLLHLALIDDMLRIISERLTLKNPPARFTPDS